MTQLGTLNLLLEQAERERDVALSAHGEAQAALGRARAQADDLAHYQGDYHRRWQDQARGGLGIETLQCYQSFGERLKEAVGQQGQLLQVLEGRLVATRAALQERELRVASLRKLIERRQAETQRELHKRDQKLNDEWAARAHRHHHP